MRCGGGRPKHRGWAFLTVLVVVLATSLVAVVGGGAGTKQGAGAGILGAEAEAGNVPGPTETSLGALPEETLEVMSDTVGPNVMRLVGDGVTKTHVEEDLVPAATAALLRYEERGDCVLAQAGYLDLRGNVWACTVQGDGWVEVKVFRSCGDGGGCDVTCVLMDASEWARELDDLDVGTEGR